MPIAVCTVSPGTTKDGRPTSRYGSGRLVASNQSSGYPSAITSRLLSTTRKTPLRGSRTPPSRASAAATRPRPHRSALPSTQDEDRRLRRNSQRPPPQQDWPSQPLKRARKTPSVLWSSHPHTGGKQGDGGMVGRFAPKRHGRAARCALPVAPRIRCIQVIRKFELAFGGLS